ncbi:MAG: hypothetical protein MR533_02250 [Prevotella sp.]|nr:hypothetical protein [Prevotella sp.]
MRRISITAGGESEANVTCGFTVCKWSVLALDFVACQSKKRANMSKQCVDATHVYRWVL